MSSNPFRDASVFASATARANAEDAARGLPEQFENAVNMDAESSAIAAPPSPAAVTYAGEGDARSPVSLSAEQAASEDMHERALATRRPKHVSPEERMNETASAVIKATTGSGTGGSSTFEGHEDVVFSERLAVATAKITTLGAQLKEKTTAAREARTQAKPLGGKELLRRLQETASSAHHAPGMVTVKSIRRGESAMPSNPNVVEEPAKKGIGYKFSAATRRTSQRLLQNLGAAEKMKDDEFTGLWECIQKQENLLEEICAVGAAYKEAQRKVFEKSKRLAELIRLLVETGDKNNTWAGAPSVARDAAMREACKMVDIAEALVQRCTPLTEEVFDWNILEPARHRTNELPAYKACVTKRRAYMQDMDAFDRQLAALRKRPSKNEDELALKEEQARRAKQRFQDFSSRLVEELSIVDGTRYEMAYSLVRGFANVQCFNLERQLDVARVLRGG